MVKATLRRTLGSQTTTREVWVHRGGTGPPSDRIEGQVPGVNETLVGDDEGIVKLRFSIEQGSVFAIGSSLKGSILIHTCRAPVQSVWVQLIRKETLLSSGEGGPRCLASAILSHQIIDGQPCPGDLVLFQVPLPASTCSLSPTFIAPAKPVAIEYLAGVLLEDASGRMFYKHLPVFIYRPEQATQPPPIPRGLNEPYVL